MGRQIDEAECRSASGYRPTVGGRRPSPTAGSPAAACSWTSPQTSPQVQAALAKSVLSVARHPCLSYLCLPILILKGLCCAPALQRVTGSGTFHKTLVKRLAAMGTVAFVFVARRDGVVA